MKTLPFTIPKPKRDALILQEDLVKYFYDSLHRHEELQISCIVKGSGTLIVGDRVSSYFEGDILVIGGKVSHVFKSDPADKKSHMFSIFFTEDSFGSHFFQTEELKTLIPFFRKAENGFKIKSNFQKSKSLFQKIRKAPKLDRFILFLQLLKELNNARYDSLSSFISEKKYSDLEEKRMSAVLEYTMDNFRREISLSEIAEQATMTKNAFCAYFKKRTRKTYVTFLNELRTEASCQLLSGTNDLSIAEIAERSGFQNISNFNRVFKVFKKQTPGQYRKQFS